MIKLTALSKLKIKEAHLLTVVSLFIIPLVYFPFLHFSFTAAKELSFKALLLLGILALIGGFFRKKALQFRTIGNSILFLLLLAQLSLSALSNFASDNPLVALYGTYSRGGGFIFELFLFTFLLWNAFALNQEKINVALKTFWVSALVLAAYGCMQKLGVEWFFENYSTNLFQGRIFSFSGNPSLLGQLLLLSTLVGVYLIFRAKDQKSRFGFGLGTLIMLLAVFLSGTRSAVLGFLVILFLTLLAYRKEILAVVKKLRWKLLLIIPILATIVWVAPADRFSLSNLSLRSLNSRFEIWEGTFQLIEEHWLLGYGQDTFYIHFPEIVTKDFFTLEEDISISADRVHNEFLETLYNHGVPAGLLYLLLLVLVLKKFFTTKSPEVRLLSALILANAVQNILSFPDPSIQIVLAFAWGGLLALESKPVAVPNLLLSKPKTRMAIAGLSLLFLSFIALQTIVRPFLSYWDYTIAKNNYTVDYASSVNALKSALGWTPYYSELWYELMFVDPSSMERALENLEVIDGESGDVLAWKGNLYAESDPQRAADYYIAALEKNPYQPNWVRAFADMLYDQGDCETALYLYDQYIEMVPDFWKWSVNLEDHTAAEQKSYETFFKHVPYFWGTLEKMEICRAELVDLD